MTDAGKDLQSYAEQIIKLADLAKKQVKKTARGELGSLKLGIVSSSVGELPTSKFQEFVKYYPDLSFDIYEDNTFGVLEKLHNHTIDLGLVRTPFNHQGFDSLTISNERMMAVNSDPNFLKNKQVSLKQLESRPLIIYRRFEEIFNESFAHQGLKPYYAVKCDDARTAILWAKKGMGTALVPESIAHVSASKTCVPVNHRNWQTHLQFIWEKDHTSPLIERLLEIYR